MRVLFIEDELEVAERVINEVAMSSIQFIVVGDVQAALDALETQPVDLAICDLKIPASPLVPQARIAHGLKVLDYIRATFPGTPVVVYSGFGKDAFSELGDSLSAAPRHDLYGEGLTDHVVHRSKSDPERLVTDLREAAQKLQGLDEIEISPDVERESLTHYDKRLLRIYARQQGAVLIKVDRLSGGRSGAVTVKLACESADGPTGGAMVAKLNDLSETEDEEKRYRSFLGGMGATCFAPLMETLLAGAAGRSALFYSLAQGFDVSLFECLEKSDSEAATVVKNLFDAIEPWREGAKSMAVELRAIRASLVSDEHLGELPDEVKALLDSAGEDQAVNVRWSTTHGDLHGSNVLVKDGSIPVLIDYGRLGKMSACLDPITLELSAVLHPDSKVDLEGWPSPQQAEHWNDLESYLSGCPIAEYVTACRSWTEAVVRADREKDATVLAYALRQLLFPDDIDPDLPRSYAAGAVRRLEAA